MHGLVGPSNPLLPASELTLMYFASHLAQTVSYETVKLYLVAVQDLHRELNFPLQLNKMHRLQKVLTGIKRVTPSYDPVNSPVMPLLTPQFTSLPGISHWSPTLTPLAIC